MLRRRCEQTDVLILGSGMAAACAVCAIRRADPELRITVATRGEVLAGGSTVSNPRGHVRVQAPGLMADDPADAGVLALEIHRGGGHVDAALATLLAKRVGPALRNWMDRHGLELTTRHNEQPLVTRSDFSDSDRTWHIGLAQLRRSLRLTFAERGVEVREHHCAVTLLTDPHGETDDDAPARVIGALLLNGDDGSLVEMRAGAVILATGGAAGIYALTLAPPDLLGDGWSLAEDVGARLANLEFTAFALAGLRGDQHLEVIPVERFRRDTLHPLIINTAREDLMDRAVPDLIDRARAFRTRSGHTFVTADSEGVRVDLAILRANRRHSDPGRPCVRISFDGGPIYTEVGHYAWATSGGVVIDRHGATGVPGLYAAGEVTTGMTGAQPPGGTRLAAALVFGELAGTAAAAEARERRAEPVDAVERDDTDGDDVPPQLRELTDDPDAPPADPQPTQQMRLFASSRLPVVPDENLKALFLLQKRNWNVPLARAFANPDPASRQAACDNYRAFRTLQLIVRHTLKRSESLGPVVLHEPLEPEPLPDHEVFDFDYDNTQVLDITDEEVAEIEDDLGDDKPAG